MEFNNSGGYAFSQNHVLSRRVCCRQEMIHRTSVIHGREGTEYTYRLNKKLLPLLMKSDHSVSCYHCGLCTANQTTSSDDDATVAGIALRAGSAINVHLVFRTSVYFETPAVFCPQSEGPYLTAIQNIAEDSHILCV
jgi:hypothetical protein